MDTIHIKDIEHYQPSYNDGRRLIWIRWDIDSVGSYKISKLNPAQRWLFIHMICMETRNAKPIPKDLDWLAHEARHTRGTIENDLNVMLELDLIETTPFVKVSKERHDKDKEIVKEIIDDLNRVCNAKYKYSTPKTVEMVRARIKEGFGIEDFKKVHRLKFKDWNNAKMRTYLRPHTLYSTKFEGYLNQREDNLSKYEVQK
jgi:uncharacterized phage protein (TIGR02220 family)